MLQVLTEIPRHSPFVIVVHIKSIFSTPVIIKFHGELLSPNFVQTVSSNLTFFKREKVQHLIFDQVKFSVVSTGGFRFEFYAEHISTAPNHHLDDFSFLSSYESMKPSFPSASFAFESRETGYEAFLPIDQIFYPFPKTHYLGYCVSPSGQPLNIYWVNPSTDNFDCTFLSVEQIKQPRIESINLYLSIQRHSQVIEQKAFDISLSDKIVKNLIKLQTTKAIFADGFTELRISFTKPHPIQTFKSISSLKSSPLRSSETNLPVQSQSLETTMINEPLSKGSMSANISKPQVKSINCLSSNSKKSIKLPEPTNAMPNDYIVSFYFSEEFENTRTPQQNKVDEKTQRKFDFFPVSDFPSMSLNQLPSMLPVIKREEKHLKFIDKSVFPNHFCGLQHTLPLSYVHVYLQALYHIPSFRNMIFGLPSYLFDNKTIVYRLKQLFEELCSKAVSTSSKEIIRSFQWTYDYLRSQYDPYLFFTFFLTELQKEIVHHGAYTNYFTKFTGKIKTITHSQEHHPMVHVVDFTHLSLSINKSNSIYDSILEFISEQKIEYHLKKGGTNQDFNSVSKKNSFQAFPEILHIHLQRFRRDIFSGKTIKDSKSIYFPQELDFKVFDILESYQSSEYELYGVIVHSGDLSDGFGHNYLHLNILMSSKWYLFNEANVERVDEPIVSEETKNNKSFKLSKNKTNHETPYILIYVLKNSIQDLFEL
jgi:hypothetical protein